MEQRYHTFDLDKVDFCSIFEVTVGLQEELGIMIYNSTEW